MKHAFRLLGAGLCLVWAQASATAGPVTLACKSHALEFRDLDELRIETIDMNDALRGLAGSETTDTVGRDYHDARCGTENLGMARMTDLRVEQPFASATAPDRIIRERLEAGTSADDFVLASAITLGNTPCLTLDLISVMQEAFTDDGRTLEPRPLEPSSFAEVDVAFRRRVDVAVCSHPGNVESYVSDIAVAPLGLVNLHRHATSSLSRPAHRRLIFGYDGMASTRSRLGGSVIPRAVFMVLSGHSLLDGPGAILRIAEITNDDGVFARGEPASAGTRNAFRTLQSAVPHDHPNSLDARLHVRAVAAITAQLGGPSLHAPLAVHNLIRVLSGTAYRGSDDPSNVDGKSLHFHETDLAVNDFGEPVSTSSNDQPPRLPDGLQRLEGTSREDGTGALVVRHHMNLIVPEPSTLLLVGLCAAATAMLRRR